MSSSDEEMEDLLFDSVTNYDFENDAREPVPFSDLPISWNSTETIQRSDLKIYVRGNAGGSLIYKPVKAWKFDIAGVKPKISVLCKGNNWLKLQTPRKSFEEECIRTILVTVNFLHLVKKKPKSPWKHIWKKLSNIFSRHDIKPSSKDLVNHMALIEHAGVQDESLKKSKCFMAVLERNQQGKLEADEDALGNGNSQFVVSDDDVSSDDLEDDSGNEKAGSVGEQDGSDDEQDGSDNEQDEEASFDSVCSICDEGGPLLCCEGICLRSFHATLRAGKPSKCRSLGFTEKKLQTMDYFVCENCQYKLHQCFACGKLGSSDKQAGAEVFQCVNATCGYFYHPHCVAKLLQEDADAVKELEEMIHAGESFTCPLHICSVCKHLGDKSNPEMQMAVCRRCPMAFHKKCLPKEISLEEDEDEDEDNEQRAWEGLLVDRILIYCLKHDINADLGTPLRDHIKFTFQDEKEKGKSTGVSAEKKNSSKKKMPSLRAPSQAPPAIGSKKKTKLTSEEKPVVQSSLIKEQTCLQLEDMVNPNQTEILGENESTERSNTSIKLFVLDSDSERRITSLMNEASSLITLDDIIEKHKVLIPSHLYKEKMDACKSITLGKVEGSCKALREAAKKFEEGSGNKEAESICSPRILNQLVKWKGKLRVYLSPFLRGMRYTSFGRHFTKYEKLEEIADILRWYVNDNDTIVDFCCGANDFSLLMKERLENSRKKCNYKNYDIFRPKNDFCFEKRDWMDVKTDELPTGSKLIMGINPPYGVRANQFINKALEFKPKLIILMVPTETERLDEKEEAYDLIFENRDALSGKSFYLPGSIDVNGKQMEDWNVKTPILSLWSRPDWTCKHMELAMKYHHLPENQRENFSNCSPSFNNHCTNFRPTEVDNVFPYTLLPEKTEEEDTEKKSTHKDDNIEKPVNAPQENSNTKEGSKKKRRQETRQGGETSRSYKRNWFSPNKPYRESRKRRRVSNWRHQGSTISGQFDHRTHHTSSSVSVRNQGNGSNHPNSDVVERYLPSHDSRFNLGQGPRQGYPSLPMGYAQRPAYARHPTSSGGWIDG